MLLSLPMVSLKADEEVFYMNGYGVEFTEEQYNYFTDMFWDGYQDYVTQDDFDQVLEFGLFDSRVETASVVHTYDPENYILGSQVTEKSRTLKISESCGAYCLMALTATWNYAPTVRSYDVMGARFSGTSIYQYNNTYVYSSNGTTTVPTSNRQTFDTGFGITTQLPSSGSNLKVGTSFYVYDNSGATVYGAYEHAAAGTTLNISKMYYISPYGQGDVLYFTGLATYFYDDANGVYISL